MSKGIDIDFIVAVEDDGTRTYKVLSRHHIAGCLWSIPAVLFDGHDGMAALRALSLASQIAMAEDVDNLTHAVVQAAL